MTKEEFIEAHIKVCHIVGGKKWLFPEGKPHKGLGRYRRKSERNRRRECAKGLWDYCQKLGIEAVMHHSELPKVENDANNT